MRPSAEQVGPFISVALRSSAMDPMRAEPAMGERVSEARDLGFRILFSRSTISSLRFAQTTTSLSPTPLKQFILIPPPILPPLPSAPRLVHPGRNRRYPATDCPRQNPDPPDPLHPCRQAPQLERKHGQGRKWLGKSVVLEAAVVGRVG